MQGTRAKWVCLFSGEVSVRMYPVSQDTPHAVIGAGPGRVRRSSSHRDGSGDRS